MSLNAQTKIEAVVLDVDGVFTDGTVSLAANGEERKSLHFADIMGVSRTRRKGIFFGLISGEGGPLLDRIAQKLGITDVTKDCATKDVALREFADRNNLPLTRICFVGDDINDVPALSIAGFSAAPGNAQPCVARVVNFQAVRHGGNGAVREILEQLFGPVE